MKIALHDADGHNFPNLALMKLSAWHKKQGDSVEFYFPFLHDTYNKIYSSKVFTFTKVNDFLPESTNKGGTGYKIYDNVLPDKIEHIYPDYSLYETKNAYGFVTRGCPNNCPWCIVPRKEGGIKPNADISEFWDGQEKIILMDNNILASDHGIKQLEKISRLGVEVDCNQGLDDRLVDKNIAKLISKTKFTKIRFACDTKSQMEPLKRAVELIRQVSGKKGQFFVYVLVKNDIEDALERVEFLRSLKVDPFAQPYRDFEGNKPNPEQIKFARWVNSKPIWKTVKWENYIHSSGNSLKQKLTVK